MTGRALLDYGMLRLLGCFVLLLAGCSTESGTGQGWPGIDDSAQVNFTAAYNSVSRFNEYRRAVGVQTVDLDYDLSRGCQLHADYLKQNAVSLSSVGLSAHSQDEDNPYFTQEGHSAGQSSIIYEGVAPVDAVDRWMRTLYHRIGLLDPNLHYVGYGSSGSYQVMDALHGRIRGPYSVEYTVMYPHPGATEIIGRFENEIPWPVPGDDSLGIPITAEFFGPQQYEFDSVEGWLQDLSDHTIVPTHLQYPGKPLLEDWDLPGVIVLIPAEPLASGHAYRVHMSAVVNRNPWRESWDFSTR